MLYFYRLLVGHSKMASAAQFRTTLADVDREGIHTWRPNIHAKDQGSELTRMTRWLSTINTYQVSGSNFSLDNVKTGFGAEVLVPTWLDRKSGMFVKGYISSKD
jgi:hypothetical protein